MACLILVVDVYLPAGKRNLTYVLTQLALIITLVLLLNNQTDTPVFAFNNLFVQDALADVLKLFIIIISFGVFVYSREYLQARNIFKGEFYVLGLFSISGMMLMGHDLKFWLVTGVVAYLVYSYMSKKSARK